MRQLGKKMPKIRGWFIKDVISVLKALLSIDVEWQNYCLSIMYSRQTTEEKIAKEAIYLNGSGFSKADTALLSKLSVKLHNGIVLTDGERSTIRNTLPKYAAQLIRDPNFDLNNLAAWLQNFGDYNTKVNKPKRQKKLLTAPVMIKSQPITMSHPSQQCLF